MKYKLNDGKRVLKIVRDFKYALKTILNGLILILVLKFIYKVEKLKTIIWRFKDDLRHI